ncbi:MAG: peptidylprolyl isomerase [Bacteroidales bacterium]|nr:peptidylprolyl isomerase [Bacteroidales bacterium]MBR5029336.1 peptidylprolyl isomerase [Bacteroidales bacterium]
MDTKKVIFVSFFLMLGLAEFAQTTNNENVTANKKNYILIETDFGNMKVLLYEDTPLHSENFIKLVKNGFYDGLLFHRVINNFMIQGGDPTSRNAKPDAMLGDGSPGYTIPAEFNPKHYHKKGALAAARQGDDVNPNKESSGSQFYIVQGHVYNEAMMHKIAAQMNKSFSEEQIKAYGTIGGTPWLDNDYTVFGEVVEGLEVIDKIAAVRCGANDRPVEDVKMTIKIIEE